MVSVALVLVALLPNGTFAGDWPQWRYDAGRGAASPDELPKALHLQWARQLPQPQPAWPASQPSLRFDLSYSPVAAGKLLVVPSMVTDSVTAYDTETGAKKWRFYTGGPVRFAPIADRGKLYLASDDGYLYCVNATDGALAWRVRGGPSDRKVLGNERLISTWPIRGGPVLLDGTIYFTAGIWPFMGIFVRAVDAHTGRVVWTNSGEGATYQTHPHNSPAFGGIAPRGHLAATSYGLVVPGGRTPPACFDLNTGKLLSFNFAQKGGRSSRVSARGKWYFTGEGVFRMADGQEARGVCPAVHDEKNLYAMRAGQIIAQGSQAREQVIETTDRKGRKVKVKTPVLGEAWRLKAAGAPSRLFLKAGSQFVAGDDGTVALIETDLENKTAEVVWKGTFKGRPWTMLAADDKLFVVNVEGRMYCFGANRGEPKTYGVPASAETKSAAQAEASDSNPWQRHAEPMLKLPGAAEGYCVVLGLETGGLAEALVRLSKLHVIAVDADARKINALRRRMDDAGLYGTRLSAHVGDPVTYPLPPYLANLIVTEDPRAAGLDRGVTFVGAVFRALRPYGGLACLPVDTEQLDQLVKQAGLAGAQVRAAGRHWTLMVREGALPGAADWTHQYADAANSVVSQDKQVRLPLGLLWFGNGPPNDEVLPRHGHGPAPQVAFGRLLIEGRDILRALDIYTGRLLWQKELPGLGRFYDVTGHQPGAGEIGSNYVSLADSVYVAYGDDILRLDGATGETIKEFSLPPAVGGKAPYWGYVGVFNDVLAASSSPVGVSHGAFLQNVRYASAGKRLVAMDRHTGKVLWTRTAKYGFRHNNIALGADKVFCIDGLSGAKQKVLQRRGERPKDYRPRLLALDVHTGKEIWSSKKDVFGTFLNYSAEHDVLLQAGSFCRDRAPDESGTGMVAYRGKDGGVIWKDLARSHAGPCLLHHDTIIAQGPAYSLLTGKPNTRPHPLTGRPIPWGFARNYGCNTAVASEHLLTFRSAAAGYYDLAGDGGTGNLGGFKSGCTSNLIAAGGLLSAPEYTRTCDCNYQNQTSLALVHDPDVEIWTFNPFGWDGAPVRRVGLNFGAAGDRLAAGGTLWLDFPSRGGPSPDIPVEIAPEKPQCFRYHGSRVQADQAKGELDWVAASGIECTGMITLTLAKSAGRTRKYTVRLHFAEVSNLRPGQRVFNVSLQGKEVLGRFDVVRQAGGPNRAVLKEFSAIEVADKLKVSLNPSGTQASAPPLLCGIEVVAEGW